MDRLPIALLGLGRWGQNYLRLLASHPAVELVAAIDPSEAARQRAAQLAPGVPCWASLESLDGCAARALIIATPADTHTALVKAADRLGFHVLVEKPLATAAAEADALSVSPGRVVMVGHLVLHVPVIERMLATLDRLGPPRLSEHVRVSTGAQTRADDPIWALGPHDVALSLRMMGRPPSMVRAIWEGREVRAEARFTGGSESRFRFSRSGHAPQRCVEVLGDGYRLVAEEASGRLHTWTPGSASDTAVVSALTPLDLECRHFVQCVRGEAEPLEPLSAAITNVHVLEAMVSSREQGGCWVAVDPSRGALRSRAMNAAAFAAPD